MGLARRRQDLQRMKAKARKLYPHVAHARFANHLTVCSCWMCGNPRKYNGGETNAPDYGQRPRIALRGVTNETSHGTTS